VQALTYLDRLPSCLYLFLFDFCLFMSVTEPVGLEVMLWTFILEVLSWNLGLDTSRPH
jgi:hypothetical protein